MSIVSKKPSPRVQEQSLLQRKEGEDSVFCEVGSGLVVAWQWCVWRGSHP